MCLDTVAAGRWGAIGIAPIAIDYIAIVTFFSAGENEGVTALGQFALRGTGAAIGIIAAVVTFFFSFEKRVATLGWDADGVFAKVIGGTLVIGGTQGDALPMGTVLRVVAILGCFAGSRAGFIGSTSD